MLKKEKSDTIKWQLKIFDLLPEINRPDIRLDTICGLDTDTGFYEYEWIEGSHELTTDDLRTVRNICRNYIWKLEPPVTKHHNDVHKYLVYCYGCEPTLMPYILKKIIVSEHLLFTEDIHGDLTKENIIKADEDGRIVLIDPSPPRHLSCIELDEAKMLQSILTGWETLKRLWEFKPVQPPFEIRPVHIGLLLTHWIRLYAHPELHVEAIIRDAAKTIEALTKFCEELPNDNNPLRYGWCLSRLKALGVPGLSKCVQIAECNNQPR